MCNALFQVNSVEVGQESESCADKNVYNIMADITLASEAPTESKSSLIHCLNVILIPSSHDRHITSQYTSRMTVSVLLNHPANREPCLVSGQ